METKKLYFTRDGFVDGQCLYDAGKSYDIPVESVDRWVRRGAVLEEEMQAEKEAAKPKESFVEKVAHKIADVVASVTTEEKPVETHAQKPDTDPKQEKQRGRPAKHK